MISGLIRKDGDLGGPFWYRKDIENVTSERSNDMLDIESITFLQPSEKQVKWGCLNNLYVNFTNGSYIFGQVVLREDKTTGSYHPFLSSPTAQSEAGEWEREADFGYLVGAQVLKAFEAQFESIDYDVCGTSIFADSLDELFSDDD